jgi:hypothetical protein
MGERPSNYQSTARTTFYARDADETYHSDHAGRDAETYYGRVWKYHHRWDDDRSGRRTFKDKLSVTRALASSLPVSKYEQREAIHFVQSHNGKQFNQYGGLIGMALGALAAIRDETISDHKGHLQDPLDWRLTNVERFTEICDRHDIPAVDARKKAKQIRHEDREKDREPAAAQNEAG